MQKNMTILTVLCCGLVAGLFFGFACAVNLGLHHLSDLAYLKAMQGINEEIQNFFFLTVFMGVLPLLPLATWQAYQSGNKTVFQLFLGATILYFVGVLGVTAVGNIPLNNQLAALDLTTTNQDLASFRSHFETSWGNFHFIRTIASIMVFVLTLFALQQSK